MQLINNGMKNTVDINLLTQEELKNYAKKLQAKVDSQTEIVTQLRETKKHLDNINKSRGFRVLQMLYRISGSLIPANSRRRNFVKAFVYFFKHPIRYIKEGTWKGFISYLHDCIHDKPIELSRKLTEYNRTIVHKGKIVKAKMAYSKLMVPKTRDPLVSIVIPVYNQFHYTYHCIQSIIENTKLSYEIIVADDVSNDKTMKIDKYIKNIVVNRNETNLGFLLNCNNAAKKARGKYIQFLNNDTEVTKDWLSSLVSLLENDDTIGMVGSKLVFSDGSLQEAGGIIWNDASGWNYGRLDDPDKPEYNYVKDVDYISGASILISRELWNEIGGFDERYIPAYFEDSDLAFEVRKRGKRVVYQPKSKVVHFEGISHGTDVNKGIKSYQLKNKEKFIEKWGSILQKEHQNPGEHSFVARDRTANKPMVLMIDHYVPTFDKDAGSRTTYHFIRLLLNAGYTVKFIGDNFGRIEPYSSILEQMGVECLTNEYYMFHWQNWLEENGNYVDFAFLARPHISVKYMDMVKTHTAAKVIYYGHDLHFLREKRAYEVTGNSENLRMSEYWKPRELGLMRKADMVFTVSKDEQKIINEELGEEKAVICPIFFYEDFSDKPIDVKTKKDLLFVGGFSHLPNVDAIKWFMSEIWPKVSKELPSAKFYIVGSNPSKEIKAFASNRVIVTGFISDEKLAQMYQKCRICVIPLRYGAGVKGKTLEAMYNRISIVSTSIGLEGYEGIKDYVSAVDEADSFANEVIRIYKNDSVVHENYQKYIRYVEERYSYHKAMDFMKKAFQR